jgi:hypothetical protein
MPHSTGQTSPVPIFMGSQYEPVLEVPSKTEGKLIIARAEPAAMVKKARASCGFHAGGPASSRLFARKTLTQWDESR